MNVLIRLSACLTPRVLHGLGYNRYNGKANGRSIVNGWLV